MERYEAHYECGNCGALVDTDKPMQGLCLSCYSSAVLLADFSLHDDTEVD